MSGSGLVGEILRLQVARESLRWREKAFDRLWVNAPELKSRARKHDRRHEARRLRREATAAGAKTTLGVDLDASISAPESVGAERSSLSTAARGTAVSSAATSCDLDAGRYRGRLARARWPS